MATFFTETKVWEGLSLPYTYSHSTSIGAEILKKLQETPERILNICHDDETSMTCHETRLASIRVAQNLTRFGLQQGDIVGIMCTNSTYLPPVVYGCLMIGTPINPIDTGFKKEDIKLMFKQTQPKAVICDGDVYEAVKLSLDELGNNALIITMREPINGVTYVDELLSATDVEDLFEVVDLGDARQALAVVMCSAGTTGLSKGVCLSHANILSQFSTYDMAFSFRSLSFSPIYWSTGLLSTIFTPLRSEDTRVMTTQPFSVELFLHLIRRYDVNVFKAAPYQLTLILQHPLFDVTDFDRILMFFALGSLVSESLRKEFRKALPSHPIVIGYGMTEACISIASTGPADSIEGLTVGRISPNVKVKIMGKNGKPVDLGVTGEIYAKPQFPFLGYYNNPEASKNAVDEEGYLKTGDIGFVDDSGDMFLIDKKKEIMKFKGYQVSIAEIESIINSIEGVEMCSVVGIPDPICSNLPAAVVVKRPEFDDLTEQYIIDFVAEKLPEYNQLHGGVYFVDELPMTPNGQIQRRFVKVMAIREYRLRMETEEDDS